jgi:hypothetical protein
MISFSCEPGILPGSRKVIFMNIRNLPNQFTPRLTSTKVAIIAVVGAWVLFCALLTTAAFLLY